MPSCLWCKQPFDPSDSDAKRFANYCSSHCENEAKLQIPLDLTPETPPIDVPL